MAKNRFSTDRDASAPRVTRSRPADGPSRPPREDADADAHQVYIDPEVEKEARDLIFQNLKASKKAHVSVSTAILTSRMKGAAAQRTRRAELSPKSSPKSSPKERPADAHVEQPYGRSAAPSNTSSHRSARAQIVRPQPPRASTPRDTAPRAPSQRDRMARPAPSSLQVTSETPQTAQPTGTLFTALVPVIVDAYKVCARDWDPMDKLISQALASQGLSRGGRGIVVKTLQGLARHHGQLLGALGRLLEPTVHVPEPAERLAELPEDLRIRLIVGAYAVALEGKEPDQAAHLVGLREPSHVRALHQLPRAMAQAQQVITRLKEGILPLDESLAAEALSLPLWLTRLWAAQRGWEDTARLGQALLEPPPLTLRVTPHRLARAAALKSLHSERGIEAQATRYSPFGMVLPQRIPLDDLTLYREGALEVQDEGSQIIALATGAAPGRRVVDLCAGAGGKILLISSLQRLGGDPAETYACDPHPGRLRELRRRLERAGITHVGVRNADALDPHALVDLRGRMDRVIVDAPCSGLGALRRNPEARWRLTPADLERFPGLQLSLIEKAATLLRKGGRIIYATCTLNKPENEGVIEAARARCGLEPAPLFEDLGSVSSLLNLDPEQSRLELLPHVHGTDGFFVATLRRA